MMMLQRTLASLVYLPLAGIRLVADTAIDIVGWLIRVNEMALVALGIPKELPETTEWGVTYRSYPAWNLGAFCLFLEFMGVLFALHLI